jgi:HEAT repeat protein
LDRDIPSTDRAKLRRFVRVPTALRQPEVAFLVFLVVAAAWLLLTGQWNGPGDDPAQSQPDRSDVEAWAQQLFDPDPDRRFEARLELMALGEPAVPYLGAALRGDEPETRREAAGALAGLATRVRVGDAIPALIEALRDPDPHVRHEAVAALRWAGPQAREAVSALREAAAADPDHRVREIAARALKQIAGGLTS